MRKRLVLFGGLTVAAGVLAIGGVAYAAAGDSNPETRYVQVVEGDSAPAADEQSPSQNENQNREDCPEKNGGGRENGGESTTEQL